MDDNPAARAKVKSSIAQQIEEEEEEEELDDDAELLLEELLELLVEETEELELELEEVGAAESVTLQSRRAGEAAVPIPNVTYASFNAVVGVNPEI